MDSASAIPLVEELFSDTDHCFGIFGAEIDQPEFVFGLFDNAHIHLHSNVISQTP